MSEALRHATVVVAVVLGLQAAAVSPGLSQPSDCPRQVSGEWSAVPLPEQPATEDAALKLLAVDPTNADAMVVAGGAVIWHTQDGGCTWQLSETDSPPSSSVQHVEFSPDGAGTVLARYTDLTQTATGQRIHRSTDHGRTFIPGAYLSRGGGSRSPFAFGGPAGSTVYTLSTSSVLTPTRGDVLEVSTDAGVTWTARPFPVDDLARVRVVADPIDDSVVWLSSTNTPAVLHRSQDFGESWETVEVPLTDGEHISDGDDGLAVAAVDGARPRVVVYEDYDADGAATSEALRYVSDDDGGTWMVETVPSAPHVAFDHVVGGSLDVEMVLARHFYPGTHPGTRALLRRGGPGWIDVSLPDLGHLEQLHRSVDPATGRTVAVAFGLAGAGSEGGGPEGEPFVWRFEGSLEAPDAESVDPNGVVVSRLAGSERIGTSVAVSSDLYGASEASSVVLARAGAFPDALAGAPLAVARGGPLLLTSAERLSAATAAELQRALAAGGTVHLLGGTAALSEEVAADVQALGYTVQRLAGATRFETAVAIAEATTSDPDTILVADGTTFPDALVAGAAAGHIGGTVVLTDAGRVPPVTRDYLDAHPGAEVITIGALAAQALPGLPTIGSGDPVVTAIAVAERFHPTPTGLGLASAAAFPDGLSGGAHAGHTGIPLLLTPPDHVPAPLAEHLATLTDIGRLTVYGGSAAITDPTAEQAEAALASS